MATGVSKTLWKGPARQAQRTEGTLWLGYEGKQTESEILSAPPAELSVVWSGNLSNRLYFGDNLKVLAALRQDASIRGQVRLIYIDPPYATSNVFQSRNQTDAYEDLLSGAHYVEFLRERLIFLRELLAEDGSIYVHLDENMAFYIKVVMDEVFGRNNFRNWITRKKCNPKNYTRKTYGNVSDYILFYSKTDNYIWHRPVAGWTPERALKEYSYVEAVSGRRYKKVPVHAPGTRNGETGKPWRGILPPPGKHWQYTPARLDEMDARGEIYWSPTGNPRRKVYLDESEGVPVQDIWLDFRDAHNQNIEITGYPTEKNPDLLAQIIEASSNPGDIVLDCFCGSGTTLAVASKLERHWIGVDNSPEAITTTLRRFSNGPQPMGDFVSDRNGKNETPAISPTTMPLFDQPMLVDSDRLPAKHLPIVDFVLLADQSGAAGLASLTKEWKKTLDQNKSVTVREPVVEYKTASVQRKSRQKPASQKHKTRS